ncbi:MAG: CocE/NonD family hydrolase [Candidatus Nanopelagicales bacterium]
MTELSDDGPPRGISGLIHRVRHPDVTVDPPPNGVERRPDVAVTMPDGTVLRVDVYLPMAGSRGADAHLARRPRAGAPTRGRYPVIMCAHPYGKDAIPAQSRSGRAVPGQFHAFRQPEPVRFSAWTGWEAPDPGYWCRQGFVLVNADLRGFGHSDGTADILTRGESEDYAHLIEWAAEQPWSNGRVGLLGVSYLAISQYGAASLRPQGLAAICPWEGLTDPYRDLTRPGGGREDGFTVMWSTLLDRAGRVKHSLRAEQKAHPLLDEFWRDRTPDLSRIDVPMLVCGSFSDHLLHSRGSHEAFRRVPGDQSWLYTHRGGKWCTFYSPAARETQRQFLEDFVADVDTGWRDRPRVRLAIYRDRTDHEVVEVDTFPPTGTRFQPVSLGAGAAAGGTTAPDGSRLLDTTVDTVKVTWRIDTDLDVVGAPWLSIPVALDEGDDALVFVGLRVFRSGQEVTFEGSYGFAGDMVTQGQLRLSHRKLDETLSAPDHPVHRHDRAVPLPPGRSEPIIVPLLPQATHLEVGDVLRVDLAGRWFFPTNPVDGQFPARYEESPPALLRLRLADATLHLPIWVRD